MADAAYAKSFDPYENGSNCDIDLTNVPEKSVRIIIHVFQKDDGSGNVPNNSQGETFLFNMWNTASTTLRNLKQLTSPTPSPYIKDAKIRYQSVGIYFWKNTTMWSKGANTTSNATALYNFVMSQNVTDKNRAIHILLPGVSGTGTGGRASGIGDKKWSFLKNVYNEYLNGQFWVQSANLRHEIGHNLGLWHTWDNDYCDDTPVTPYQQYGYDNNVINYNPHANALTHDQITRMHRSLQDDSYILYYGAESAVLTGTINVAGNSSPLYTANQINATTATVNITGPSVPSITWTKTSGTGSFYSSNAGKYLSLSNLGSINLQADWIKSCSDFSATYVFYKGYSYSAGPNPATNFVEVREDGEQYSSIEETQTGTGISKVEVYNYNNDLVDTQSFASGKAVQVDVTKVQAGVMYLRVTGSAASPVVLKMIKQ